MIGYIIVGLVVLIFAYIFILYYVNSKKIKKKQAKKAEPDKKAEADKKSAETKQNKVEVKSQVIKGTMFEEAVKQAEEAGYKYNDKEYQSVYKRADNSRLKLEREEFISEIKKADAGRLQPQKLKLDREEGPTKNKTSKKAQKESIDEQIKNLSPELKAILLNDVLNKKY